MYPLQSIIVLPDTTFSTKMMYKMRNIHEGKSRMDGCCYGYDASTTKIPDVTQRVNNLLENPLPELNKLKDRQRGILNELTLLRRHVDTCWEVLKRSEQKTVYIDLMMSVNPKVPPYSIFALHRFLKDTDVVISQDCNLPINSHKVLPYPVNSPSDKNNVINLMLTWSEVDELQFTPNLYTYPPIRGESNFLRFISRLIHAHNYEITNSSIRLYAIDKILDLCYYAHHEKSPNGMYEVLSAITNELKKMHWKGEGEPSIADIAAWSTFKQLSPREIPSCLQQWYRLCEEVFM